MMRHARCDVTLPGPNDHSMIQDAIEKLAGAIRDVPDFPKPGIIFKDITPLLGNPELFSLIGDVLADPFRDTQVDKVVGIDARGFIFATQVAERLNAGQLSGVGGKMGVHSSACARKMKTRRKRHSYSKARRLVRGKRKSTNGGVPKTKEEKQKGKAVNKCYRP